MDELTLTTLQRPQVQVVRAPRPESFDPQVVRNIVGNRGQIDRLVAQAPGALAGTSIGNKVKLLNELESQLDLQTTLLRQAPAAVGANLQGRGITRIGGAPLIEDARAPLRRNQLELASVIERLKGNVSTARELARQAASVATEDDEVIINTFQQGILDAAQQPQQVGPQPLQQGGEGQNVDEAIQLQEQLDRRVGLVNERRTIEEDIINAKGDALFAKPNSEFASRILGNRDPEEVLGMLDEQSITQEQDNLAQTSRQAEEIFGRAINNQQQVVLS